jgi:hypothetical protein
MGFVPGDCRFTVSNFSTESVSTNVRRRGVRRNPLGGRRTALIVEGEKYQNMNARRKIKGCGLRAVGQIVLLLAQRPEMSRRAAPAWQCAVRARRLFPGSRELSVANERGRNRLAPSVKGQRVNQVIHQCDRFSGQIFLVRLAPVLDGGPGGVHNTRFWRAVQKAPTTTSLQPSNRVLIIIKHTLRRTPQPFFVT